MMDKNKTTETAFFIEPDILVAQQLRPNRISFYESVLDIDETAELVYWLMKGTDKRV